MPTASADGSDPWRNSEVVGKQLILILEDLHTPLICDVRVMIIINSSTGCHNVGA